VVLDYDRQWEDVHGFHFYDFNGGGAHVFVEVSLRRKRRLLP
jgi:hypothetical protein